MIKPRAKKTHPQLPKAKRTLKRMVRYGKQLEHDIDMSTRSMMLTAVEYGFRMSEQGHNLTHALIEANALWRPKRK